MRSSLLLVLLCLYGFQCNAAPPREVATTKKPKIPYNDAEDDFIIEELSLLPAAKQERFSREVWEHMAKKHHQKRQQGIAEFRQERTAESIRTRFTHSMAHNHALLNKLGPDHWLQKYRLDLNKPTQGKRPKYTPEERIFIIEELSKPSCTNLYAIQTWDAIEAAHNAKMIAGDRGFENERKADGLRSLMSKMKQKGELPEELLKKIRKYKRGTGASSSEPTHPEE